MSGEPKEFARLERHSAGAPGSSVNAKAKKEGGGGKFTMGKPGDEDEMCPVDRGDPNYDSEDEEYHATAKDDTVFDKIIRGEIPCASVYDDETVLAFNDNNPQAPTHIVVIPKDRDGLTRLKYAKERHQKLLGHMMVVVSKIARQQKLGDYRVIVNDGAAAGQAVKHLHLHILAGRQLGWPPG